MEIANGLSSREPANQNDRDVAPRRGGAASSSSESVDDAALEALLRVLEELIDVLQSLLGGGEEEGRVIEGGDGDDRLLGGDGDDAIRGGGGDDRLRGRGGDDLLRGQRGEDRLRGGDGDDRLRGGFGRDDLFGGRGDDDLRGGAGDDRIDGGPGVDVANFAARPVSVNADLSLGRAVVDAGFELTARDVAFEDQGGTGRSAEEILEAARAGDTYLNVHSEAFPGGEVRGQFEVTSDEGGIVRLRADLSGENEAPPADTNARGEAFLTIDVDRGVYDIDVEVEGLDPDELNFLSPEVDSPIHVHLGSADENGPIALNPGKPELGGEISKQLEVDRLERVENLLGGSGDDRLRGDGGANTLSGGAGDDWLDGGGGDRLIGGEGGDRFRIDTTDAGEIAIADFESGVDRLDLSRAGRSGELDGRLVYDRESGALGARRDDGQAQVFARLEGGAELTDADIEGGSLER